MRFKFAIITISILCLNRGFGAEPTDPGIDLLLQKGIITEDEAAKAKAASQAIRENNATNQMLMPNVASPWKISSGIKELELFGDVRVRYEDREGDDPYGGHIDLQRFRYAVRVGLRGNLADDFSFGVRVDTSANPRSPWVTMGSSTSGTPYQGPFGKSQGGLNIGQAYLGWQPESWVEVSVGKMPNPLYTSSMVWDPDLNPEGLAERFKYTIGEADLFANFGQFLYQDTNPEDVSGDYFGLGNRNASLPFLLAWQGGVDYHITSKINWKMAATLYNYIGFSQLYNGVNAQVPDFSGTYIGEGATQDPIGAPAAYNLGSGQFSSDGFFANQTAVNDLLVLDIPAEFNIKLHKLNFKVFGDFAYNLNGTARANAAYTASQSLETILAGSAAGSQGFKAIHSPQPHDVKAYQFGLAISSTNFASGPAQGLVYGTVAKKHAWEARTYWQHVEQYALDPNLMDSDFFEGRENLEGIYSALAYGFSDNITGTVRYGYAARINNNLGTGGSNQDILQMNPIDRYHLFQVDLSFRF